MAGIGPFALLWVGATSFSMTAKSANVLNSSIPEIWSFLFIYPLANVIAIAAHYHLSPPMYAWLRSAPLPRNRIDHIEAWNANKGWSGDDLWGVVDDLGIKEYSEMTEDTDGDVVYVAPNASTAI